MGYEEAVAWLDALGVDAMRRMRPNTARMEAICELLDHPERTVPAVHITGTNGKTSTAHILSGVLSGAGLSVGTFTSPHLQDVRERILFDGQPLSREDFGEVFDHLRPYLELVRERLGEPLTYFEVLTAMFFLWAAESPVDALVVEVGLGGRWDATNVVPARVAVVTNIGLDHTELLGEERETIAKEKAGIIKPGAVAVTGERTPSVLGVIAGEAEAAGAELRVLGRHFELLGSRPAVGGRQLSVRTTARSYDELFLPLHGPHQAVNAALALEAAGAFVAKPLDPEVVSAGLARVRAPGRMETLHVERDGERTSVLLDVAHNVDGMAALVRALADAFTFERVVWVFGALADKDIRGMLAELARLPGPVHLASPATKRAAPVEELARAARDLGLEARVHASVEAATRAALEGVAAGDIVCITGSHYVVGEARSLLA